jgi:hypothetical protein
MRGAMKNVALVLFASMLAVACGGQVGSSSSQNNPGTTNNPGDPSNPNNPSNPSNPSNPGDPGQPSDPGNPGQPGGNAPAIIVDITAAKGDITAIATFNGGVYATEVVRDNTSGGAAAGTTVWAAVNAPQVALVTSADVGIPLALGVGQDPNVDAIKAKPYWIDGVQAFGNLKTITNGTIATLTTDMAGTELTFSGASLYGDFDDGRTMACIVAITDGTKPTCVNQTAYFANPLQGGSGFKIVGGTMYAVSNAAIETIDLASGTMNAIPFPTGITSQGDPNDKSGNVFDLAVAPDGSVYLATRTGVWKKDASNNFTEVHPSAGWVQQIELAPNGQLVDLELGPSNVSLVEWTPGNDKQTRNITDSALLNTRFAIDSTNVYWIDIAGKQTLHTAI